MDVGQLENPYSSAEKTGKTGGTGLFKIGDYDEPKKQTKNGRAEEPGLVQQAGESIKDRVSSTINTLSGNNDSNSTNQ
ncbi:hypothetical protein [Parasitella parasitica]|uniref:Uncharacterized protein n=1 Tax=Parasitella parasitica TaxID=35722 RepID=A0A0B7NP61_9FUNG|nr:hypothetical protein [Parasitella parasitica]